jgi:hypothetical protein
MQPPSPQGGESECDTTLDEEESNLVPILMSDYYKSFK